VFGSAWAQAFEPSRPSTAGVVDDEHDRLSSSSLPILLRLGHFQIQTRALPELPSVYVRGRTRRCPPLFPSGSPFWAFALGRSRSFPLLATSRARA
jgi:hypothetical protein